MDTKYSAGDIDKYIEELDAYFSRDNVLGDEADQRMSEIKYRNMEDFIRNADEDTVKTFDYKRQ